MNSTSKNVSILAVCQAPLFTNNTTAIAINGLAGFAFAADVSPPAFFAVMVTSSFLFGLLHESNGWNMLNYLAIAPVLIIVFGLLWQAFQGRQGGGAMPVQS